MQPLILLSAHELPGKEDINAFLCSALLQKHMINTLSLKTAFYMFFFECSKILLFC